MAASGGHGVGLLSAPSWRTIVRVPLREPIFIRQAFDAAHGVVRTNVP